MRYDSNPLRLNDLRGGAQGDVRYTPSLAVDYRRRFGLQQVVLTGDLGYDFNQRFTFLDRERIELSGGFRLRAPGICRATPTAAYVLRQADVDDLDQVVRNKQEIQRYTLDASCERVAGLGPFVSLARETADNSLVSRRRNDLRSNLVEGGIAYRRPSLGRLALFGSFEERRYPGRDVPIGGELVADRLDIAQAGLRFERDLGVKLSGEAEIAYARLDALLPTTRDFDGLTYRAMIRWRATAAADVRFSARRSLSSSSLSNVSYFVQDRYALDVDYRVSPITTVRLDAALVERDARGRDPLSPQPPRPDETNVLLAGAIRYAPRDLIDLTLRVGYNERDSDDPLFNYESTQLSLTTAFKFY